MTLWRTELIGLELPIEGIGYKAREGTRTLEDLALLGRKSRIAGLELMGGNEGGERKDGRRRRNSTQYNKL